MVQEYVLGSPILWASVLTPIAAGLVNASARRGSKAFHTSVAAGSWAVTLALLLPVLHKVLGEKVVAIDPWYVDTGSFGTLGLFMDPVSAIMALSVALVSLIVAAYSAPYMEHRFEEMGSGSFSTYFFLYQLFTAGMLGSVLASNAILFYLFLELTLIPSALLIVLYGYGDRFRVGLIYLIWTHVGAVLFVIGLFVANVFDFYVPGHGYVVGVSHSWAAFLLVLIGASVKMAMGGLHLWLPYAHAEAPTPISALLSPLLIGIGGYVLLRAGIGFFPDLWRAATPFLFLWAVATMLYGGFLVLAQRDIKRLFAYSSISQMGYLMLGLSIANTEGEAGAILHYLTHALGKAILFGVAGVFIVALGTRDLKKMGGLLGKMPYTGALALTGFMLISGLPPTMGMWSEVYLVFGFSKWAMSYGLWSFVCLTILVMAAMTLTVIYSFTTFKRVFYGPPGPLYDDASEKPARGLIASLLVLLVLAIVFFIFMGWLADPLAQGLGSTYALR
ncbi:hypothetical protein PYJP_07070 [Pyrofollis japonicus]|uniref:complex I subunit 5 family protein n=1 Tax=Pyrofollis japonicus TaxID=3060460 RepID=UPI00295BD155|nr:complex I subunit 5 family protein [Pyrofollis japonicus]BEP17355.1 hypothetical protein PYJP_07070 [Pyrofollis japonicus]